MPPPAPFTGWLPCPRPDRHPAHDHVYVDPTTGHAAEARCDGETADEEAS